MNLIGNCCIAGYIYQRLNKPFGNPFQWCFIEPGDLFKMINNYDSLNFNKIDIVPSLEHKNTYVCIIDNLIKIKYIHYVYNKNIIFKQANHNIESKNIKDYIYKKYFERLSRMQEKPIFIYLDSTHKAYENDNIDYLNTDNKFKKILITKNKLLKDNTSNNLVIFDDNIRQTPNNYPVDFCNRYFKTISTFISK